MDEGNPSATKTTLIVAQECSTARLSDTFVHLRCPRVQHGSLGQHFRTFSSPKGTARHAWATLSYIFVARGCSTALLGNTFALFHRPRVQRGTLGQHFRTSSSPEGAARLSWATLSCFIVAQGCSTALLGNTFVHLRRPRVQHGTLGQHFRTSSSPKGAGQNDVWMKETLRQRKPHLSLPKSAARLSWATLSYIFVARGCTARLGNTFALFRRPRVQHGTLGQHFRTSSSPEGAARLSWATLSYIFVARGCSTARLSNTFVHLRRPRVQHGSLGRHFRTSSSPEGAARHAWATPPHVSAARRYWAKDVRLNLTKKKKSPKNEGDFCRVPKAGLEPARL